MQVKFYQVGGCVRDEILGTPSKDVDYVVECDSFEVMRAEILARGGEIFLETPQYYTIRAKVQSWGKTTYDFVLARKDGEYRDGRRPETVEPGTIYDDLARRDFTMNAIAKDETGKLIDPHNGREDIRNCLIRAVGDPAIRLNEDKLRAFRAIRFAVTKGFEIQAELSYVIRSLRSDTDFQGVSTERVREELVKACKHNWSRLFYLLNGYPNLWNEIRLRDIWFKPTTEAR